MVSVGDAEPVRAKNFRAVRPVVAAVITNLMARDPEAAARDAMTINAAFETGAAEHSVTAHGSWSTTVTVDGEPVPLAVIRKCWW